MSTSNVKDLEKMTMAQLKESLAKKGLPTDGKKAVLVDRLAESIRKAEEDAILNSNIDSVLLASDDILNSASDVLGDISADAKIDADSTEPTKEKTKVQAPSEESKEEQKKRAQRLGLPIGGGENTGEEARKRRAERFGLPLNTASPGDAKAKRAERFGTTNNTAVKMDDDTKEKLLKRAQRFGIPVNAEGKTVAAAVDPDALAKRAARFGMNHTNDQNEAAKKARLERFSK
ncbi:unnamed protein product [Auanema sp. JU1783]|nr:unnamed protein product [Auanema sp. JU1783]